MTRAAKPDSGNHGASGTPWLSTAVLLCCVVSVWSAAQGAGDPATTVRKALSAACNVPSSSLGEMAARVPGGEGTAEEPLTARGTVVGWTRRLALRGGGEIRVERFAPGGRLRRLVAEYWAPAPGGGTRPRLAAVADGTCAIRVGRRLVYEPGFPHPIAVEHLDQTLESTGRREPLNPAVPPGRDPGGVPVALVDAGVNYRLPQINRRLARGDAGGILGYDYWDGDARPFDANPARSPFFPQRHGTKTASLLLNEAPQARLVPYRYPRPDMSRMRELIRDAAAKGVTVVNMSMGSNDRSDWEAFAAAARAHPEMLFVLSAGNNGRDIDARPVYPAALALDNAITVTSAENDGELARGSNWGKRSVDLLVPAERVVVTGFDGSETTASGSSYAAARISALAARLLAAHPEWRAPELKHAIFSRTLPSFARERRVVAGGFIPRPDKAERLPPMAGRGEPRVVGRQTWEAGDLYPGSGPGAPRGHLLKPVFAYFEDTAWTLDALRRHARRAAAILARCGIHMAEIEVRALDGPVAYRYFHDTIAEALVGRLRLRTPAVYFVRDTLQVEAYDAEAIGKSNSATRPTLRYTVWFTEDTRDPGVALAHELMHLLMDSGAHVDAPGNLMRAETAPSGTTLAPAQCEAAVTRGTANGLLTPPG